MKFLVTSDLHLSDRIWRHRPIEGDSYHSWNQIVDLAISQEVQTVILAGDILDRQANLSVPVQQLTNGLIRLRQAGIAVWYNQGQHEYQQHPWMQMLPDPFWFEKMDLITPEGWILSGCDYRNTENLQAFLRSDRARNADVLVTHQVWQEFMGELSKPQGAFTDIPPNVQLLITGDYHEHLCQKFGALTVMSPGATHLRSIAEPLEHEVFLLELGPKKSKPKIKSLELRTRRRVQVSTKGLWDFELLATHAHGGLKAAEAYAKEYGLPPELQKPLLQLSHRRDEVELVRKFTERFHERAHLFFKPQLEYQGEDEQVMLAHLDPTDRVSMLSCLDHFVDREQQPLTYSLAVILLQSPDPEQALQRWVKEQTCST